MDGLRFGRQFRALRIRLGRRQPDVSSAPRVSRSQVSRIEQGHWGSLTVGTLMRAAAALGADVEIRLRWRGEQLDRLVDEAHAAIVETVVRRLRRLGWIVEVEVSFNVWGERGSIDAVAFLPAHGALLIVEVKSVVPDSQATLHGLDRKARLAREILKDRRWAINHVSRLLVIGSSATSRRRVARLAETYDVVLPARSATVRGWLPRPDRPIAGLLFVAPAHHGSTRPHAPGRERVRRRKAAQLPIPAADDRDSKGPERAPVDTATGTGR